jgi:hypothetical protein
MYADSTILDDGDDDDRIIDTSINGSLDGQFEDITASTKIIQPVLL